MFIWTNKVFFGASENFTIFSENHGLWEGEGVNKNVKLSQLYEMSYWNQIQKSRVGKVMGNNIFVV